MSVLAILIRATLLFAITLSTAQAQSTPTYQFASGSVGATFYPLAQSICAAVERHDLSSRCTAVATPGSAHNLEGLQNGLYHFALSQQHLQKQAFEESGPDIRTVMAMHVEVFTIAAARGVQYSGIKDLRGKRVNIGNQGSGTRIMIEALLDYLEADLEGTELMAYKSGELPELFCDGDLDIAIYSTGHPNRIYQQLTEECQVSLLDLWDEDIATYVASSDQLQPSVIAAGTYANMSGEIRGFGTQVVLSASATVPAGHVAELLEAILLDWDKIAEAVRPFQSVPRPCFCLEGAAPYHPGAESFSRALSSAARNSP